MEIPDGLTPNEAAAESGLHIQTVRELCREGKIKAEKVFGRAWIIDRAELPGLRQRAVADRLRLGIRETA